MSGIAGAVGPPDRSIDPDIATGMSAALVRLGPDRQDRWSGGPVFLARALLATTFEETRDVQPLTFDGVVHLVADARIDGRAVLIHDLRARGRVFADGIPDSALILHAYHVWGEACVERLIGDFAFAIWDGRCRRLFCARDQFGSVPFYFARIDGDFCFANTVTALLAHPKLDRSLNPVAIGDYLMFGYSMEPDTGFYRWIERLPPAHTLVLEDGEWRTRRYWTCPEPQPDAQAGMKPEALIEAFGATMAAAVRDRLRTDRVGSTLSGGMDSTLVTGLALREAGEGTRIDSYSFGSDWLLPDTERHWAWLCAHHLGVPFHSISLEQLYLNPPGDPWRIPPEPRFELRASSLHVLVDGLVAEGTRVLLMGMGGDTLVAGGRSHWASLIASRQFGRLMVEAAGYWRYHRRRPPVRSAWRRSRRVADMPATVPFDPTFVREHRLDQRWREMQNAFLDDPRIGMTGHPFWTEMFVASHPESSGLPLRVRQPFFDVRLIEAAMRLPPTPWQFHKAMLRRIGDGILPTGILKRPKTPFGVNPGWEAARQGLEPWLAHLGDAVELDGIVDRKRLARTVQELETLSPQLYSGAVILPAGLAAWLRHNPRTVAVLGQ